MRTSPLLPLAAITTLLTLSACSPQANITSPDTDTPAVPTEPTPTEETRNPAPTDGWTLHIDARKHFSNDFDKDPIAHHYCKPVRGGLTECQLYDGDGEDARLVGVEMVISADAYNALPEAEKKGWHYHKTEIPRVDAKLPDVSEEEAAKIAKSLEETYGKVYILWNPAKSDLPMGDPYVTEID